MKHAFIRIADSFGPRIPNPSPPEYRREKGARSIKLVFGALTPSTIFYCLIPLEKIIDSMYQGSCSEWPIQNATIR